MYEVGINKIRKYYMKKLTQVSRTVLSSLQTDSTIACYLFVTHDIVFW